jgi:hypothetical protein
MKAKIYIVTCDKIKYFETFASFESAIKQLDEINKQDFDGNTFSYFGRPYSMFEDETGREVIYVEPYFIDSVVLTKKRSTQEYYTFLIRCIDQNGKQIEL